MTSFSFTFCLLTFAAMLSRGLRSMFSILLAAPEGYEDATGFHYGKPQGGRE